MEYVERETGRRVRERVVRAGLFHWMYTTEWGRRLRPLLLDSRWLHRCVGWFADSSISRPLIPVFARAAGVKLEEAAEPIERHASLNAFFTRRLDPRRRPIDPDPNVLVSPGDGKLLVVPELGPRSVLTVKGLEVGVAELTADADLAGRFLGGSAAILRLYLGDYHRVHFPADGVSGRPRMVPGSYYSVSPFTGNDVNFYLRNVRAVTMFHTSRFGCLGLVEVGGFLISSIRATFAPGAPARKGEEKGAFAFGGSTLVMLAERGRVTWDQDLGENSAAGLETGVKLGSRIGLAHICVAAVRESSPESGPRA